jgi:hypothetical protein
MSNSGLMKTLGLAGAALAAWYFLDPNKGADRRNRVARGARDLYDTTRDEITRVGKDLADGVSETMQSVSEGVSGTMKSVSESVGETVKSVSEGVGGLIGHGAADGAAASGASNGSSSGRAATGGV